METNQLIENTETKRTFASGATRDGDMDKLDFEGFFVPEVIECFGEYMHKHRKMADGSMRDSDNWQKGFPIPVLMKSLWRHFFYTWKAYRRNAPKEELLENLNGVLFNTQALMFEFLRKK